MRFIIVLVTLALTVLIADSRITSLGLDTAESVRAGLADSDFLIDPAMGTFFEFPDAQAFLADLNTFPALAATDVQSQVVRVTVRSGGAFLVHFHPRGAEIFNAIQGTFNISFTFEGVEPRTVLNTVVAGQSTIFPQGLIHTTECVSEEDCIFVSNFNTADPGLVAV